MPLYISLLTYVRITIPKSVCLRLPQESSERSFGYLLFPNHTNRNGRAHTRSFLFIGNSGAPARYRKTPSEAIARCFGDLYNVPHEAPRSGSEWDTWDTFTHSVDVSHFSDSNKQLGGISELQRPKRVSQRESYGTAPKSEQTEHERAYFECSLSVRSWREEGVQFMRHVSHVPSTAWLICST